jgi:hypothetical protein
MGAAYQIYRQVLLYGLAEIMDERDDNGQWQQEQQEQNEEER